MDLDAPAGPDLGMIAFLLVGALVLGVVFWWMFRDAAAYQSGDDPAVPAGPRRRRRSGKKYWNALFARAQEAVDETLAALPPQLRREARRVPCQFRTWSDDEGFEDDFLGLYHGFEEDKLSEQGGPIQLFLGNIDAYCRDEGLDFEDEVRATYLHELGHHLGWDEDEIERRGL